jgi:hypothetical protein
MLAYSRNASIPLSACSVERVLSWEDKFRRLPLQFERLSQLHYTFKMLAYTMINVRHIFERQTSIRCRTVT